MSSLVLSHVVRRGIAYAPQGETPFLIDPAHQGHHKGPEINMPALLAAGAVMLLVVLVSASLEYTIGQLMATLAMVEAPTETAVVRLPAFSDDPNASSDKKLLDTTIDVEIAKSKPITASLKTTIRHLHRIGGFRARWRGFGQACLYVIARDSVAFFIGSLLFGSQAVVMIHLVGGLIATLLLCRTHMLWTHAMITMPSNTPWYRRYVARRDSRILLLPAFVYAITQRLASTAPFILMTVASQVDSNMRQSGGKFNSDGLVMPILCLLAAFVVHLLFIFFVALPASGALAIIETCLLPEHEETIVPTNRALLYDIDLSAKGAPGKAFAAAWKSFSIAARLRVVKLYVKLFFITMCLGFIGCMLSLGILYVTNQLFILALATFAM